MESLICELHLPEPNEPSEQSSVQAHSAWQRMSRAGPRLGSVPSLEISALYDSVPSRVSRAELALLTLPSLPAYTPLPTNLRPRKRDYDPDNPDPPADQTLYREIVGSLNHPAQWTRPDAASAISKLSQYLHDPSIHHLTAAKHLLRYFKGTIHFRQVYSASQPPKLVGYADADHANDEDDRKSFSGYCFFLSDKSAAIS